MSTGAAPQLDPAAQQQLELVNHQNKMKSGANWFYWIAALSLINTIISISGGRFSFIFGLGLTQVVDAFAGEAGRAAIVPQLIISAFIAALVAGFGFLANKEHAWAFWVGMVCYAGDGLLCLLARDFLATAFHAWAIFGIYGGVKALQSLQQLRATMAAGSGTVSNSWNAPQ